MADANNRILIDPSLEQLPDHTGEVWAAIRRAMLREPDATEESVLESLAETWRNDNARRRDTWARQVEADRAAAEEERREEVERARERAEEEAELRRREEETALADAEKKRPKVGKVSRGLAVSSIIPKRPSQYAKTKLENGDYVELYYFTPAGLAEALTQAHSAADTYSFTRVDENLTLRPLATAQPSKRLIRDDQLTWDQFSVAAHNLIQQMILTKWTDEHIQCLSEFFANLESHPLRLGAHAHGPAILLRYQSRIRAIWHDQLKKASPGEDIFDISIINEDILRECRIDVSEEIQMRRISEVSSSPNCNKTSTNSSIPNTTSMRR